MYKIKITHGYPNLSSAYVLTITDPPVRWMLESAYIYNDIVNMLISVNYNGNKLSSVPFNDAYRLIHKDLKTPF